MLTGTAKVYVCLKFGGVCAPRLLAYVFITVELFNGDRHYVMPVNILHNGVVCLIEYVGTVTKGPLCSRSLYWSIFASTAVMPYSAYLVEGVQKLFKIAPLLCRVIFKHAQGDIPLNSPVNFSLPSALVSFVTMLITPKQ